ncbi:MAG: hypothetical protein JW991_03390 [Candidatus Pacebacteria bacterium]|nr:hypothetical protein [Candidatus Paceibacterota bacterium]
MPIKEQPLVQKEIQPPLAPEENTVALNKKYLSRLIPRKKIFYFILSGLILVFILAPLIGKKITTPPSQPMETTTAPTPTYLPSIASASAYAKDPVVLELEKELWETEEILNETNFREPALFPPEVDKNIWIEVKD